MKIKIQFKDPDAPYEAIQEAAKKQVCLISGIEKDEKEILIERRHEQISKKMCRWLKYGEYITVEFDLDAGTACVLEAIK